MTVLLFSMPLKLRIRAKLYFIFWIGLVQPKFTIFRILVSGLCRISPII